MNIICEQNGLKFEGISCGNRYEKFYVPKFVLKRRDDHFSLIDSKGNVATIPFAGIEEVNLCGQVYPDIDSFEAAFQDIIYVYNNPDIELFFSDDFASFPVIGLNDKLYIDKATNLSYRWNGASYVLVGDGTGAIVQVANEADRDLTYPAPANGFQVYNQRTNNTETYYTAFELWLSSDMVLMISESLAIVSDRLIYVGAFFPALGFDYATTLYPTAATFDDRSIGVIIQDGAAIDAARRFVAVAVRNQYYIEFGEAVAVGEFVYPKTEGVSADLGFAAGSSETNTRAIGIALQNSGQTVEFPTKVLVEIGSGLGSDLINGFYETFKIYQNENIDQNLGVNTFYGARHIVSVGKYSTFGFYLDDVSAGVGESGIVRAAVYNESFIKIREIEFAVNDATPIQIGVQEAFAEISVHSPQIVYIVFGYNDRIGNFNVQAPRIDSDGAPSTDFVFSFVHASGVLPPDISAIRSASERVYYSTIFKQ